MKIRYKMSSPDLLGYRLSESGIPINVITDGGLINTYYQDDVGSSENKLVTIFQEENDNTVNYFDKHTWNVDKAPSWILIFQNQLRSFRSLHDDWNGYGSLAPNSIAIKNSQNVLDILHKIDFSPFSIVPSAEDGIAISFAKGKRRAIIECYNDGNIVAARYEIDSEPLVWNVGISEEDIKESINRIYDFIH